MLAAPGFLRAGLNSILVAMMTVAGVFLVGVPAAYALAKLRLRGAQLILAMLLSLSMFPAVANVAPLYLAAIRLGIRDSIFAVAVAHAVFTLPFAIWIMVDFLQEIPDELYRAARVDGCSHLGVLRHVVLPVALPGLLSVGLLVFIFSWNEFLYAFTLTASEHSRTLPVAIALFPGLAPDSLGRDFRCGGIGHSAQRDAHAGIRAPHCQRAHRRSGQRLGWTFSYRISGRVSTTASLWIFPR